MCEIMITVVFASQGHLDCVFEPISVRIFEWSNSIKKMHLKNWEDLHGHVMSTGISPFDNE